MSAIPIVLYLDDDDNDVLLLRHALHCARLSFDVRVASDPEIATAYLAGTDGYADRERHPLPALVLLDLKMPRMNGLEVLAWIRRQPRLKRLIVIVLTASNHGPEIDQAYESGANSYLIKPVELGALVEIVRAINSYWMVLNQNPSV